ncbi:MAG: peptide-methionine (R)-S-oxide reductase MsrB [Saprospiraceae bacterium]|nr:peptide-methionine (R)-S-oxide reductase MsrB [Saprospiraceae bacterium]
MKSLSVLSFILLLYMTGCSQPTKENIQVSKPVEYKVNFNNIEDPMKLTEEDWKKILTKEQYSILRQKGTERPHTGALLHNKEKGIYKCAGCGNELFTDEMKFESHCGWPSFDKEIAGGKIKQKPDLSYGMRRIEILCARCDGHLGHIFDDGPTETGMRYCVNSLSLVFEPAKKE